MGTRMVKMAGGCGNGHICACVQGKVSQRWESRDSRSWSCFSHSGKSISINSKDSQNAVLQGSGRMSMLIIA